MTINWHRITRKTHYWGAIICALPIVIVLITGLLLQVKKQSDWIQPPTLSTNAPSPLLSMSKILQTLQQVPEINVTTWADISRLDIRPNKGVIKAKGQNHWEVQIDQGTGEVLQVAYRRTDLIESLHDGSFFHEHSKLWVFLPAATILTVLWLTGMYLFVITWLSRRRSKRRKQLKGLC